eukprot:828919-Amphidinium_carterae.2
MSVPPSLLTLPPTRMKPLLTSESDTTGELKVSAQRWVEEFCRFTMKEPRIGFLRTVSQRWPAWGRSSERRPSRWRTTEEQEVQIRVFIERECPQLE